MSLFELPPETTVSYSRLALYLDCPRRYRHVYGDGLPQYSGPSTDMLIGVAVHSALAKFFSRDNLDRGRDDFERLLAARLERVLGQQSDVPGDVLASVSGAFSDIALTARPELVESAFRVHIGHVCVRGRFDRVDVLDTFRHIRIVDYKVREAVKNQHDLDADLQLGIYALAAKEQFPAVEEVELVLMYLDVGKVMATERSASALRECAERVVQIVYEIEQDTAFLPRKSRYCGICHARDDCPEIRMG